MYNKIVVLLYSIHVVNHNLTGQYVRHFGNDISWKDFPLDCLLRAITTYMYYRVSRSIVHNIREFILFFF